MLHLITGTPGSGKTLLAVSLLEEYVKANKKLLKEGKEPRCLYADIDGLEMEGVEPAPDDWRDTPDGSVIFYDEIQQRAEYKKQKGSNDIVSDLQIHRHTGHDIYGITQFPVLLHPDFKAVVGLHYHLHRGWGLSQATVYQWAYCVDSPNAKSNKRLAEHTFTFNYPKRLYDYYKSATQHTHKRRIPKKFIITILLVLIGAFYVFNLFTSKDNTVTNIITGKAGETEEVFEVEAETPKNDAEDVSDDVPATTPFEPVETTSYLQNNPTIEPVINEPPPSYVPNQGSPQVNSSAPVQMVEPIEPVEQVELPPAVKGSDSNVMVDIGSRSSKSDVSPIVFAPDRQAVKRITGNSSLLVRGTSIPCVLNTRIDSTYKGFVVCQTTRDVYSSDGSNVLIKRGSRVFGEQNLELRQGQARVSIIWNNIKTPDGLSIDIEAPAVSPLGQSGIDANVNSHFWKRFGGAIMVSMVQDVIDTVTDGVSGTNTERSSKAVTGGIVNDMINIPPTATVPQGTSLSVMVVRDIDFDHVLNL